MSMFKQLWCKLKTLFTTDFSLPELTLQIAIFGFQNVIPNTYFVLFITLLMFKKYVHQSRETRALFYETIILQIITIKKIDKIATHSHSTPYEKT